jgi:hypothetical protein
LKGDENETEDEEDADVGGADGAVAGSLRQGCGT